MHAGKLLSNVEHILCNVPSPFLACINIYYNALDERYQVNHAPTTNPDMLTDIPSDIPQFTTGRLPFEVAKDFLEVVITLFQSSDSCPTLQSLDCMLDTQHVAVL